MTAELAVVLTLGMLFGAGQPDIEQSYVVPSLQKCFDLAGDWVTQDYESLGALAVSAKCWIGPAQRKS